ncbi:MAG: demethoxyubiquinone hydroxylase family protein [Alphaproteobacteria bacterium]|nr:MAG: demethoxyubiquinone hydroxylase family protein [Alphaproteobacteria bacterium]
MTKTAKPEQPDTGPTRLPGDRPWHEDVARMLRVDHAGEYGAARIYDGQLSVMGDRHPAAKIIRRMREQEVRHLETFDRLLDERRVRPTLLTPLWHAAGFALGAATALAGPRTAMACTAAVEEVIDDHYAAQEAALEGHDAELSTVIGNFREDENEHRDLAIRHGARDVPGYPLLAGAIKVGCRLAIWMSKRI